MNEANDSKFVTRKWNIVSDLSNSIFDVGNQIIYNTEDSKSTLCDYNDAYLLLRGDITIIGHQATQVALNVLSVTLSARENQKVSKLLSKRFERLVYWNEYKTKTENKNTTNEFRYFLKPNFVGVNRLFVLIYWNRNDNLKRFNDRKYLPKGIIKNFNVIINGKNFYDQPIDSHIKRYAEIRN